MNTFVRAYAMQACSIVGMLGRALRHRIAGPAWSAQQELMWCVTVPHRALSAANGPEASTRSQLMKLSRNELVERVKSHGVGWQSTGTKAELVERIMSSNTTHHGGAGPLKAEASDDDVHAMKVADLKARLKALGAKTTGKKSELQTRLRALFFLAEEAEEVALEVHRDGQQPLTDPPARMQSAWQRAAELAAGTQSNIKSSDSVGSVRGKDGSSVADADSGRAGSRGLTDDENAVKSLRMSGGQEELVVTVDKMRKRKDTDDLGLTHADREKLLKKRVLSLYRRCLRSAERCPDALWRKTMIHYVRGRFRDSSGDTLPLRLSTGEAELEQMNSYHEAREQALVDKERRFEDSMTALSSAGNSQGEGS